MPIEMIEEETFNQGTQIKVIGVGGGGGNAVGHMIDCAVQGVEFICANTDAQALSRSDAHRTIQLGSTGLGAGSKPDKAREAAVAKIERPQTGNAFDDGYNYGYRLWEAKFYPEAQTQLEETVKKFPSHSGTSRARNLLGRAWLDDGRPSQAAKIFYENYKADAKGERAPESLYFLGESFIAMEKPTDACDVFKQLEKAFPGEAAGRLAARLTAGRKKAKCS